MYNLEDENYFYNDGISGQKLINNYHYIFSHVNKTVFKYYLNFLNEFKPFFLVFESVREILPAKIYQFFEDLLNQVDRLNYIYYYSNNVENSYVLHFMKRIVIKWIKRVLIFLIEFHLN